jgi:hypothetical protein
MRSDMSLQDDQSEDKPKCAVGAQQRILLDAGAE